MIGKLPTEEELEYMRQDLEQFDDPDRIIDDSEDFLQRVPYYLETILAMDKEIRRLKACLR